MSTAGREPKLSYYIVFSGGKKTGRRYVLDGEIARRNGISESEFFTDKASMACHFKTKSQGKDALRYAVDVLGADQMNIVKIKYDKVMNDMVDSLAVL